MNPQVKVYDGKSGQVVRNFLAFAEDMTAGVRVASAYVDDDSLADIVVSPGAGPTAVVKVFSGATGKELAAPMSSYAPFGKGYNGGVYVAASNDPPPIVSHNVPFQKTFFYNDAFHQGDNVNYNKVKVQENVTRTSTGRYHWEFEIWNVSELPTDPYDDPALSLFTLGLGKFSVGVPETTGLVVQNSGGWSGVVYLNSMVQWEGPPIFTDGKSVKLAFDTPERNLVNTSGMAFDAIGYETSAASGAPGRSWARGPFATNPYPDTCPDPDLVVLATNSGQADARARLDGIAADGGTTEILFPGIGGGGQPWTVMSGGLSWGNRGNYENLLYPAGHGTVSSIAPYLYWSGDRVLMASNADAPLPFDYISGIGFVPTYASASSLIEDTTAGLLLLNDGSGNILEFYDFTSSGSAGREGQFKRRVDASGNITQVVTWDSSGRATELQMIDIATGATESLVTQYNSEGYVEDLSRRRRIGSGTWETVAHGQLPVFRGGRTLGGMGSCQYSRKKRFWHGA